MRGADDTTSFPTYMGLASSLVPLCFPAKACPATLECVFAEESSSFVRDQTWLCRHDFLT